MTSFSRVCAETETILQLRLSFTKKWICEVVDDPLQTCSEFGTIILKKTVEIARTIDYRETIFQVLFFF